MNRRMFLTAPLGLATQLRAQTMDIGQQLNSLYASLPPEGGVLEVGASGSFATPIVFNTPGKRVLLRGRPGITLTYTGSIPTPALVFDYGMDHEMSGHGLRDLTLTGPGNHSGTIGIQFGGQNGAEGICFRNFKVQGFGIGAILDSHTWLAEFEHGMFRDNGTNVLLPHNLVEAGEQIRFNHVTFADAPAPHTNSVWVQGRGQEILFRDCSFDQAQLRIGNGQTSAAQVVISGCHFENSNYSLPNSEPYLYLTIDQNHGNLVRLTDSYFFDGGAKPPATHFIYNGGILQISGNGGWSPSQMVFAFGPGAIVQRGFISLGGVR